MVRQCRFKELNIQKDKLSGQQLSLLYMVAKKNKFFSQLPRKKKNRHNISTIYLSIIGLARWTNHNTCCRCCRCHCRAHLPQKSSNRISASMFLSRLRAQGAFRIGNVLEWNAECQGYTTKSGDAAQFFSALSK
jgi:hypothetical protein